MSRMPPKPHIHDPQHSNMREVYLETLKHLAQPFDAITMHDWPLWNKFTGGFRMKEFSIFCGGTGTGKTTFLANVSAQLLKQGQKHFVMSVETGRHDYMRRILSVLAGRDLNMGEAISTNELSRLHVENAKILESNVIEFSHYEDRTSVEQLKHDIEHMVLRGCKIAMIDNLNFFMEVTSANNQVVEMDRVIHELIIFCKHVDVHIVMVMHQKKTQSGRVENEFDIKGSSTAVQEAQNVFLWNRPTKESIEAGERGPYDRELTLNKMRRRGIYTGRTLVFNSNGTSYYEKGFA
jgi:KaiC/GvpD/RAD55 family RecA-like ATPase